MRRLLFLLLALVAFGSIGPASAAAPRHAPDTTHVKHMSMPSGHCPDQAGGCAHVCLGCATEPGDLPAVMAAPAIVPIVPTAFTIRSIEGRSLGFDTPPPRLRG